MQSVALLAFALGVMLSPDSLILLGNTAGSAGSAVVGGLLVAGGLHVLTALTYGRIGLQQPADNGESQVLRVALGALPATVLPLCARGVYAVCATTGILAIAGYVFNEVFVYWFPNLGFSFCLLGVLVGLNLLGRRAVTLGQLGCVTLALGGILYLSAVALLGPEPAPLAPDTTAPAGAGHVRSALTGLVLFVGFELALFTTPRRPETAAHTGTLMALSIVVAGLVFGVWGLTSLGVVVPARLADSTVPHMLAARAISGHSGRVVMGLVVLAGTCAAVNVLLSAGARMLAGLAGQGLLPAWLGRGQARPALLLLALGPALMMATGMAGEPETEVFARAGVVFWLLHYAALHLAVLVGPRRQTPGSAWLWGHAPALVALLSLGALVLGALGLVWNDREAAHLLQFMGLSSASVACVSLVWLGWRRFWSSWGASAPARVADSSPGK